MVSFLFFRQCDFASYIDQFKFVASLDYASMANNFVREGLVLGLDLKPVMDSINEIYSKAETCAKDKAKAAAKIREENEAIFNPENDAEFDPFADFDPFESEVADFEADAMVEDILNDFSDCVPLVDKFTIGEISGKFFVNFFDTALNPEFTPQ